MKNTKPAELDSWNSNAKFKPRSLLDSQIEQYRQKMVDQVRERKSSLTEDQPNYFNDMEPEYKNTKRLLIKKTADEKSIAPRKELFAVKSDNDIDLSTNVELGDFEDFSSTNFITLDDETGGSRWGFDEECADVEGTLKELKEKEKQQRLEKHQQRKNLKLAASLFHSEQGARKMGEKFTC